MATTQEMTVAAQLVRGASKRVAKRRRRSAIFNVTPRALQFLPPLLASGVRRSRVRPRSSRSIVIERAFRAKFNHDMRGRYRVFNAVEYWFYRSLNVPPAESDTPFETGSSLPHTSAASFANGIWYVSVSLFNGVINSGFLPVGPNGETYQRFTIESGAEVLSPPDAPAAFNLELRSAGVVRVMGSYSQAPGALRATEWAITFTTDGSTPGEPPAIAPTVTVAVGGGRTALLQYDLPPQAAGVTVKVRLQTRLLDGATYRYSEASTVLTVLADAVGPTAPASGNDWAGGFPTAI